MYVKNHVIQGGTERYWVFAMWMETFSNQTVSIMVSPLKSAIKIALQ
jgi:hypothetical protein